MGICIMNLPPDMKRHRNDWKNADFERAESTYLLVLVAA